MAKIFLYHDSSPEWSAYKIMLKKNNHECQSSIASKKAMSVLESDPSIDLIIAGTLKKDLSRVKAFLAKIKAVARYQYIPVLVSCASLGKNDIIDFAKLGIKEFVTDPFDEKMIEEKIQNGLANGKKKVLIVDDEKEILNILKFVIEIERFNVQTATSAIKALEILSKTKIDAIISDIMLPGMTGLELLKRTKNKYPGIPVIMITGHSHQYTPQKAFDQGADGFFAKPFKNVEIVSTLRKVISQKKPKLAAK